MKTICITGMNGFIASYVTKEALDRGYNVIGNTENGDYIYKEDRNDWIELYRSCHRIHDYNFNIHKK